MSRNGKKAGPGRLRITASTRAKIEDEDLGRQEELDVLDQRRQRILGTTAQKYLAVEEQLLDVRPAGRG